MNRVLLYLVYFAAAMLVSTVGVYGTHAALAAGVEPWLAIAAMFAFNITGVFILAHYIFPR